MNGASAGAGDVAASGAGRKKKGRSVMVQVINVVMMLVACAVMVCVATGVVDLKEESMVRVGVSSLFVAAHSVHERRF